MTYRLDFCKCLIGKFDEEVIEIKKVLSKHLSKKLLDEVDQVVKEKDISEKDYGQLKTDHLRTKPDE